MALTPIGGEKITVSSTALGFTAAQIPPTKNRVIMARVQHRSGGNLFHLAHQSPVAGGTSGEFDFRQHDEIEVWGDKALTATKFIIQTGEDDGIIAVQYYGEGGS
jgi:hypothetical protein